MTGTDKGFEPELTVDRATMYEMFWKMEGKPVAETGHLLGLVLAGEIPDGAWYSGSARWAYQSGLTTGTGSGAFSGDRAITWPLTTRSPLSSPRPRGWRSCTAT